MRISYVFAALPVRHRDEALAWYVRLFGRAADFLPNDDEAVWRVAETGSVYLIADADRAGGGEAALVVDDLEALRAELKGRSIETGEVQLIPGAGRKSLLIDPDGNRISFIDFRIGP